VTLVGHAENVTTLVSALVGFHAVLHHTSMFAPTLAAVSPEGLAPFPQHGTGGLAFSVCWLVEDVANRRGA
jgi:hypothetical protein